MCWHYSIQGIDRDVEIALVIVVPLVLATRYAWKRLCGGRAARVPSAIMIVCCALVVSGSCTMGFGYSSTGWWHVVKAAALLCTMFLVEIARVMRLKSEALPRAIVVEEKFADRGCCDRDPLM